MEQKGASCRKEKCLRGQTQAPVARKRPKRRKRRKKNENERKTILMFLLVLISAISISHQVGVGGAQVEESVANISEGAPEPWRAARLARRDGRQLTATTSAWRFGNGAWDLGSAGSGAGSAQNSNGAAASPPAAAGRANLNWAPKFAIEPPSLVEYSNSTGTVIACQPQQAAAGWLEGPPGQQAGSGPSRSQSQAGAWSRAWNAPTPTSIIWRQIKSLGWPSDPNNKILPSGEPNGDQESLLAEEQDSQEATQHSEEILVGGEQGSKLRFVRDDGSLVLSPFKAGEFRKDLHSASYRCCLRNRFGASCSRPVRSRAVMESNFQPDVFDVFALARNVALLKCQVPAYMAKHVEYTAWLKDDKLLSASHLSLASMRERSFSSQLKSFRKELFQRSSSSPYGSAFLPDDSELPGANPQSKYIMAPGGELYIRNVSKAADQGSYKCRVRYGPGKQVLTSRVGGQLMVDDSRAKIPLKLGPEKHQPRLVWAHENTDATLCVHFQAQPAPNFRWFSLSNGQMFPLDLAGNLRQLDSCLVFTSVQLSQAGEYLCEASNKDSSERTLVRLEVSSAQLSVQLNLLRQEQMKAPEVGAPFVGRHSTQMVPYGSSATLNCSISGTHFDTILWLKDSKMLARSLFSLTTASNLSSNLLSSNKFSDSIKLVQPNVISVESVTLRSRGLYQCQAFTSGASNRMFRQRYLNGSGHLLEDQEGLVVGGELLSNGHLAAALGGAERDFSRSASASIQLEIPQSRPTLVSKFPSQTIHRNSLISLKCSASGVPAPKIFWFLDKQPIGSANSPAYQPEGEELNWREPADWLSLESSRPGEGALDDGSRLIIREQESILEPRFLVSHQLAQTSGPNGPLLVSQLNVSRAQPTESGLYRCLAVNSLGSSEHAAHLLVLASSPAGPQNGSFVQLRAYQPSNVTSIAGRSASLQCPLVGFPLARVDWFKGPEQRLPLNHRQRVEPIRLGFGGSLELSNLDKEADAGLYTCRASLARTWPPLNLSQGEFLTANAGSGSSGQEESSSASILDEDYASGLVGQVRLNVKAAPLIDSQSLPEVVQATEGMRTKLVCSVVQGDHPVEIKWLKRVSEQEASAAGGGKSPLAAHSRLAGFELMQNSAVEGESGADGDLVTIHNLEDSCLLTFKRISYHDTGEYLCLAQNEVSLSLRSTWLMVKVAPGWSVEPASELSVLLGARLQLDCAGHGYPTPSVLWKRELPAERASSPAEQSAEPSPGRQREYQEVVSNYRQRAYLNGSLIIEQVEQADAGRFMCELSNGIGGGLSKLVRLTVNTPPFFKQRASSHSGHLAGRAELKCLVHGDQPMLVGWQKELSEVVDLVNDSRHRIVTEHKLSSQAFESELRIDNLRRNDSGFYLCIASNEFGTDQMRVQLIVQEPPEAPVLLRPVRTSSRQATLSFRQPYAGNSLIKKYSIGFRLASETAHTLADWNRTSEQAAGSNWQQILVDAPTSGTTNHELSGFGSNSSSMSGSSSGYEDSSSQQQLVHLNLCCLQPYTGYWVQVKALNELGAGESSKPVQLLTDEEAIGGPPLDVSVEPTGAHSLKVRWRAPARNLQNGLIRGYYIGYRASAGPTSGTHSASSLVAASGLSSGKIFESSESEQYQYKNVQLELHQTHIPGTSLLRSSQPLNFNTSSPESSLLSPFEAAMQGLPSLVGSGLWSNRSGSPQVFTSYLTNLRRKTAYSIIVQAYNKIGAGPRSDQIIVSTLDAAPPMSPILRPLSVTHNSVLLSWEARRFNLHSSVPFGANNNSHLDLKLPLLQRAEEGSQMGTGGQQQQSLEEELALDDEDNDSQSYYTINFKVDDRALFLPAAGQQQQLSSSGLSQVAASSASSAQGNSLDEWQQRRVQKRQQLPYVLGNLRCGSRYLAYMTATNSLGQSEPGQTVKFATLGGAPIAPTSASNFLQVNSSFALLRLGSWLNAGCLISSFTLKYKSASQAKWTILEHQVHPTIQTVTISGSAVFSTRSALESPAPMQLNSIEHAEGSLMERAGLLENARRYSNQLLMLAESPVESRQLINDFVIRNLFSSLSYRLIVEASSEAGSTIAEYELETGNFSASTISIQVNGNVENFEDRNGFGSSNKLSKAQVGFEASPEGNSLEGGGENIDFSYGSGQQRYGLGAGRYNFELGVWSVSALLLLGSVLMILSTLLIGFRSLVRMKGSPNSLGNSRDSLISAIFCCSSSSSADSSAGADDSSHSSSAGGTCYQTGLANQSGALSNIYGCLGNNQHGLLLSPLAGHANQTPQHLHQQLRNANTISGHLELTEENCDQSELNGIVGASSMPFRSLVSSSSLSTIHTPSLSYNKPAARSNGSSHTLSHSRRLSGDEEPVSKLQVAANRHQEQIRAHYAATLGKHNNSTFLHGCQPVKFNHSPGSLYGRQLSQQLPGAAKEQYVTREPNSNYQMFGQSSSVGTSGYETSQRGAGSSDVPDCQAGYHLQQANNANNNENGYQMSLYGASSNLPAAALGGAVAESNLFELAAGNNANNQQASYQPQVELGMNAQNQAPQYHHQYSVASNIDELAKQVCQQQLVAEQLSNSAYGMIFASGQQAMKAMANNDFDQQQMELNQHLQQILTNNNNNQS